MDDKVSSSTKESIGNWYWEFFVSRNLRRIFQKALIFINGNNSSDLSKPADVFILERNLKWISYDKFKNVEYLDEGGFGIIYKAIWSLKSGDNEVILKSLSANLDKSLNELIYHAKCLESTEIINLYGYTKNPDTLNYMAVMKYANKGSLRRNLAKIIEMNWKQRLFILYKIISGLYEIHNQNLIHCDFHDANILIHKGEEDKEKTVFISDFGLSQPVKSLKKNNIYGVLPFVAPEILRGKPYTPASDIYSFSMIMWEFTSGILPFNDRAHDAYLILSIYQGERPNISKNTPQCYLDLMEKCWNGDPLKRPSALEVKNIIGNWIFHPYGDTIYEELKSNIMEFINIPNIPENNDSDIPYNYDVETRSHLIYTSRLLNTKNISLLLNRPETLNLNSRPLNFDSRPLSIIIDKTI